MILCAGGGDVRQMMLDMLDIDKLNGEYAFIAMDLSSGKSNICTNNCLHVFILIYANSLFLTNFVLSPP
jgi:hypothetical protein